MPTASGFPLWLTRTVRALAWLTLALGLCLGAAWTLLHVWIVPRIADFRPALEQAATRAVGLPVRIGQIQAESTGWVPSFELRDIRLLDGEGRPALSLPRVVLAISVRSLLNQGLEQLVLDHAELDVRRTPSGQWLVAGLTMGAFGDGDTAVADWLFAQREVVVRGGRLHWHTPSASEPAVTLNDVDIVLRNGVRRHDWRIDATPPAAWGERFVLMGQFSRSLLSVHPGQFSDWTGQLYAWLPQIDVDSLRQHLPVGWALHSGKGRLRMWSEIKRGQWTGATVDADLQAVELLVPSSKTALTLETLSGRVSGTHDALGWSLRTQALDFITQQGLHWPGGNVHVQQAHASRAQTAKGELHGDHLDLQALREVALKLPLPTPWLTHLAQHPVSGQIQSLSLQWAGDISQAHDIHGHIEASKLHIPSGQNPDEHWPGLEGGELDARFEPEGGQARLSMPHGGWLSLPGWLEESQVPVQRLQAELQWKKKDGLWHLPQWRVQLQNEDLQGQAQGQWQASETGPGTLDLKAHVEKARADRVHRYLPVSLPQDVRHYVRDSVQRGQVSNVQIRVRGDLARVPMRHVQDGEFRFAGQMHDVDLAYVPANLLPKGSPPWPTLQGLQGQLVFERQGMQVRTASARIGDARQPVLVSKLQADIPDLTQDAQLRVQADLKGQAAQVLRVLQLSPVNMLLSGALTQARATGSLHGPLQLDIPLLRPTDTQLKGQVVFTGNSLQMSPIMPLLERVAGSLAYTESEFRLQDLRGQLLGGAVRVDGGLLLPDNSPQGRRRLQFRAQGQLTAEGLRTNRSLPGLETLAQQMQGQTDYSLSLSWRDGQPEIQINSSLRGMALDLPAPLSKPAGSSMPLWIRTSLQAGPSRSARDLLQIQLGDSASAIYERDVSGTVPTIVRGNVVVGADAARLAVLPRQGVSAQISLQHLPWDEWAHLWPNKPPARTGESAGIFGRDYLPGKVSLRADTLTVQGRTLHQVVAGISQQDQVWSGNIDAQELNGHLEYSAPSDNSAGQIRARLARLDLPPAAVADVESMLEAPPASIPALDIRIDNLGLRGKRLGLMEIEAINQTSGTSREWLLRKLNLTVPEAALRASGRWTAATPRQPRRTELDFKLDVEDAGRLLARLEMPGVLRAGQGQLSGKIGWQGSPMGLHYPSMDGQMQIDVRKGQFLKADPGVAKLLGVLNLQALPRRLLFDFKDVFSEGFAFDTVQGDLQIRQGIASTRNLHLQGVNALVRMEGTADIAQETQQLKVLIFPQLDAAGTSLMAGLAINPAVGLTSFMAQWLLKRPLSRAAIQELNIDGSWSAPRVSRVDRSGVTPSPATAPDGARP